MMNRNCSLIFLFEHWSLPRKNILLLNMLYYWVFFWFNLAYSKYTRHAWPTFWQNYIFKVFLIGLRMFQHPFELWQVLLNISSYKFPFLVLQSIFKLLRAIFFFFFWSKFISYWKWNINLMLERKKKI